MLLEMLDGAWNSAMIKLYSVFTPDTGNCTCLAKPKPSLTQEEADKIIASIFSGKDKAEPASKKDAVPDTKVDPVAAPARKEEIKGSDEQPTEPKKVETPKEKKPEKVEAPKEKPEEVKKVESKKDQPKPEKAKETPKEIPESKPVQDTPHMTQQQFQIPEQPVQNQEPDNSMHMRMDAVDIDMTKVFDMYDRRNEMTQDEFMVNYMKCMNGVIPQQQLMQNPVFYQDPNQPPIYFQSQQFQQQPVMTQQPIYQQQPMYQQQMYQQQPIMTQQPMIPQQSVVQQPMIQQPQQQVLPEPQKVDSMVYAVDEYKPKRLKAPEDSSVNLDAGPVDLKTFDPHAVQNPEFIQEPSKDTNAPFSNTYDNSELINKYPILDRIQTIANKHRVSVLFNQFITPADNKVRNGVRVFAYDDKENPSPMRSFIIEFGLVINNRTKLWKEFPFDPDPDENNNFPACYLMENFDKATNKYVLDTRLIDSIFEGGWSNIHKNPAFDGNMLLANRHVSMIDFQKVDDKKSRNALIKSIIKMSAPGGFFDGVDQLNGCRSRWRLAEKQDRSKINATNYILTNIGCPMHYGDPTDMPVAPAVISSYVRDKVQYLELQYSKGIITYKVVNGQAGICSMKTGTAE